MQQLIRTCLISALTLLGLVDPPATGQTALYTARAESAWDGFGAQLESLGDIDGDGYGDVAVSCVGTGVVRVLSGADGRERFSLHGGAGFGLSLAHGDYDGDGVPDIAVGVPLHRDALDGHEAGAVFLYSGIDGALIHAVHGGPGDHHLGHVLFSVGDRDGGGADDLLIGGLGSEVRLVSGEDHSDMGAISAEPSGSWRALLDSADGAVSRSRALGDLDGDGMPDWGIVPSPLAMGPGSIRLLLSSDPSASRSLSSGRPGDCFGWSLSSMGDVNGDGVADIVVGAPGDDTLARDGGAVHVFSGRTDERLFVVYGERPDGRLGGAVAGLSDVNGDGVPDLCATAQDGAFGLLRVFASRLHEDMSWSAIRFDGGGAEGH